MPKLIPISPGKLIKLLRQLGFEVVRIKGSHHFLENLVTKKITTVALHGSREIKKGTLKGILNDIGMSVEEYEQLRLK